MSLRPGIAGGSLASPLRKARRKLINGKCLSSTVTTSNPFDNLVVTGSGSDKGRSANGAGNSRRKVSVTILFLRHRIGGAKNIYSGASSAVGSTRTGSVGGGGT